MLFFFFNAVNNLIHLNVVFSMLFGVLEHMLLINFDEKIKSKIRVLYLKMAIPELLYGHLWKTSRNAEWFISTIISHVRGSLGVSDSFWLSHNIFIVQIILKVQY